MDKETARYRRAVAKRLSCGVSQKWKLLKGFQESLDRFLEEVPSPSYAQLAEAFGPPEELASTMMGKVSDQEKKCYKRNIVIGKCIAAVLVLAFIAFTIYVYAFKELTVITVTDEVFPTPTTYETAAPLEGD